jgi:AAA+ ATPase superfamily predicted ATPase
MFMIFLEKINNTGEEIAQQILVMVDEAQELRKAAWARFDRLLAYTYDNLKRINLLLSGSQFGLLINFLGVENPQSYLFGRPYIEIKTSRLSDAESFEFLELGFRELNMNIDRNILYNAIDKLDGIIGWLTFFGYTYSMGATKSIEEIMRKAIILAIEELNNFLSESRSAHYKSILKLLSERELSWSELKGAFEKT